MKNLSEREKETARRFYEGYKVRRAVRQARREFESIINSIEGTSVPVQWSPHSITCNIVAKPNSREARLRELKLKREMYVMQLKVVNQKIREREELLSHNRPIK